MDAWTIIKIIGLILSGAVTTLIPCIIKIVTTVKAYIAAKTDAEKEKATNDMLAVLNTLVVAAENTYKDVNAVLKKQGGSAAVVKKESVMTKLQAYALEKGYTFDADFWSAKIDEVVDVTKEVNATVMVNATT